MADSSRKPTDSELAILGVLWSRGPCTVRAVHEELDGRIPLIIDGGACSDGLESTIIAIDPSSPKGSAGTSPGEKRPTIRILRPGPVTREELRKSKAENIAEEFGRTAGDGWTGRRSGSHPNRPVLIDLGHPGSNRDTTASSRSLQFR